MSIEFNKTDKILASGSNDHTIILWNVENIKKITEWEKLSEH